MKTYSLKNISKITTGSFVPDNLDETKVENHIPVMEIEIETNEDEDVKILLWGHGACEQIEMFKPYIPS